MQCSLLSRRQCSAMVDSFIIMIIFHSWHLLTDLTVLATPSLSLDVWLPGYWHHPARPVQQKQDGPLCISSMHSRTDMLYSGTFTPLCVGGAGVGERGVRTKPRDTHGCCSNSGSRCDSTLLCQQSKDCRKLYLSATS